MTNRIVLALFLLLSLNLYSQNKYYPVSVSYRVDTNDSEIKQVYNLWKNYLNSRPDSIYDNPYWSQSEKIKYNDFDLARRWLYGYKSAGIKYNILKSYTPMVLSIEKVHDIYEIKTIYINYDTNAWAKPQNPWAIQNVYCKIENDDGRLFNTLQVITENWKSKQYGHLIYYFPEKHIFNEEKANETYNFINRIKSKYGLNNDRIIEYYITENSNELTEILGLYYLLGASNGYAYWENNQVFSGNGSERYDHEIVHILFNEYRESCSILNEGIATYLGGTGGKSFKESVKSLAVYLKENENVTIDTITHNVFINGSTEIFYVSGAVLCSLLDDKGGAVLLKEVLSKAKNDEDLFKEFEREFNESHAGLNNLFKNKVFAIAEN